MDGFKFLIGDFVIHRGNALAVALENGPEAPKQDGSKIVEFMRGSPLFRGSAAPLILMIVERSYQEFPGGVQRHYVCRLATARSIQLQPWQFNEIELDAAPQLPEQQPAT